MNPQVLAKLKAVEAQYAELMRLVSDASVQADPPTYRTHAKALSDLQPLVDRAREYHQVSGALAEARELASGDAEMKALADEEIPTLEQRIATLTDEIRVLLVPKDQERRPERGARDSRRHRRRRSRALCGGAVSHVQQIRRAARLEDRRHVVERERHRAG